MTQPDRIIIRQAKDADAALISEILCASIRQLCALDHGNDPELVARWSANKTPADILRGLLNPDLDYYLAEYDGRPAGVGCIQRAGEVLLTYVAPAHRFCGISRVLLCHGEGLMMENGINVARLTSTETAHDFYRRAGWTDRGEPEVAFGITGYPMEKRL